MEGKIKCKTEGAEPSINPQIVCVIGQGAQITPQVIKGLMETGEITLNTLNDRNLVKALEAMNLEKQPSNSSSIKICQRPSQGARRRG